MSGYDTCYPGLGIESGEGGGRREDGKCTRRLMMAAPCLLYDYVAS